MDQCLDLQQRLMAHGDARLLGGPTGQSGLTPGETGV
jgi:hypothetical protein